MRPKTCIRSRGVVMLLMNDLKNPDNEVKPFNWLRGYHVGGRSLMWGRQVYRLSPMDFEANAKDGFGVDWPVRYDDIKDWYTYVEKFVGVSGRKENLPQLPDSYYLEAMEMTCAEEIGRASCRDGVDVWA